MVEKIRGADLSSYDGLDCGKRTISTRRLIRICNSRLGIWNAYVNEDHVRGLKWEVVMRCTHHLRLGLEVYATIIAAVALYIRFHSILLLFLLLLLSSHHLHPLQASLDHDLLLPSQRLRVGV